MKLEFELIKETIGWNLVVRDELVHKLSSRRKALYSIIRRIEMSKPPNKFKITVEDL